MSFGTKVNRSKTAKHGNKDTVKRNNIILSSAIYTGKVTKAYLFESPKSKAYFAKIEFEAEGKRLYFNECFQSGDAKGNKTYWVDKDKVEHELPGYTMLNEVLVACLGEDAAVDVDGNLTVQDIFDLHDDEGVELKTIPIYDKAQGKEIPTKVPVITCILGKEVKIGVFEAYVDIPKKVNGSYVYENGNSVPSGKSKKVNTIDKFFNIDSGCTFNEFISGEDAAFYKTWNETCKGVIQDLTQDSIAPKAGESEESSGGKKSVSSLFKNKK